MSGRRISTKHIDPRAFKRFTLAKHNAKARGLEFRFTLEEWVNWWINNLGDNWLELRGPRRHQFVMARFGDKGHYEINNVKCITASENCSIEKIVNKSCGTHDNSGEKNPRCKLTECQVKAIYKDEGHPVDIAKRFGVNRCTVNDIKAGRNWKYLIKD